MPLYSNLYPTVRPSVNVCILASNREMATRQQVVSHRSSKSQKKSSCCHHRRITPTRTVCRCWTFLLSSPPPVCTMSSTTGRDLGRALCIITGASKGFGRALAKEMSRLVKPRSVLVLVARSGDELRALQAELARSAEGRAGVEAECVVADLGQPGGVDSVVRVCKERFREDMDHIILVNNAGKQTTGKPGLCYVTAPLTMCSQ